MEVLVYEFFSAGGSWQWQDTVETTSLLSEGAAMVSAVADDLGRLDHVNPVVIRDRRLSGSMMQQAGHVVWVDDSQAEQHEFDRLVAQADWTILVAPEWDQILLQRARRCLQKGGRLLGPGPELIQLASDKVTLAHYLQQYDLPVPAGCLLQRGDPLPAGFDYPAVLKPRFGAGSAGIRWIVDSADQVAWDASFDDYRLESYCPGVPASVAVLMGPAGNVVLPPCYQSLSRDRTFLYLGGQVPINDELVERAERLAHRVAAVLPRGVGYVGLDIVLGEDSQQDVLVEVNPRLTTSYVGLSSLAKNNLAEGILRVAEGQNWSACFKSDPVRFDASGKIMATAVNYTCPASP